MLREGRELIPTAKGFQLMIALRGLKIDEFRSPELTGEWEYKLSQIERGELSREAFMGEIADMTQRIVHQAKSYESDTIPGDFATLEEKCPRCGGVVKENYKKFQCQSATSRCGRSLPAASSRRTRSTRCCTIGRSVR
jgi:DNA topoisomerase-3